MRNNLKAYKQVNVESALLASDPHQVILMMFDGALSGMAEAMGAIERKDMELKSKSLTKAINIFTALQDSLDAESQPEISKHFSGLYSYCISSLIDLSISQDIVGLENIINLVKPLREAWSQMPEEAKQEGISLLKDKDAKQDSIALSGA